MKRPLALLLLSFLVTACGGGGGAHPTTDPDAAPAIDAPASDPATGSYTGALLTDTGDQAILDVRVGAPGTARTRPGPVLAAVSGTATFPATSFGAVTITGTYDPQTHALSATLTGTGIAMSATFDGTTFVLSPNPHVTISLVPGAASLVQAYCGTFQSTDQTTAGRWTLLTSSVLGLAAGAYASTTGGGGVLGGSVDGAGALALTMTTTIGAGANGTATGTSDGAMAQGTWSALGKSGTFAGTLAACPMPEARPPFAAQHTFGVGGAGYFLAVTQSHTVIGWGDNTVGELGNGATSSTPVAPSAAVTAVGLANIVAVAAGDFHALALASDGTVYGWGLNQAGELGGIASTSTPKPITALAGHHIVAIAAGNETSMAIDAAGAVLVFGANDAGQLGIDTNGQAIAFPTATSITGAGLVGCAHSGGNSYAVVQPTPTTSQLLVMGQATHGDLGNGTQDANRHATPTPITTNATTVLDVSGNFDHALAILDGKLYYWGNSEAIGVTPPVVHPAPFEVTGAAFPRHIAAGFDTTFYADVGGHVWSLGYNVFGDLGTNQPQDDVHIATPTQLPTLADVIDLAAAGYYGAALTSTGEVYTWGKDIGPAPVLATAGITVPE